jgi:hypothetical protein
MTPAECRDIPGGEDRDGEAVRDPRRRPTTRRAVRGEIAAVALIGNPTVIAGPPPSAAAPPCAREPGLIYQRRPHPPTRPRRTRQRPTQELGRPPQDPQLPPQGNPARQRRADADPDRLRSSGKALNGPKVAATSDSTSSPAAGYGRSPRPPPTARRSPSRHSAPEQSRRSRASRHTPRQRTRPGQFGHMPTARRGPARRKVALRGCAVSRSG